MGKSVTTAIATDGEVKNDQFIKNDSGCCIFAPLPESPVSEIDVPCVDDCASQPTNPCGLTHPDGSGTLAGCKSTTLPHFGVVMNKKAGICRQFGYYTSGNTEEYENECGSLDKLDHTIQQKPCVTETTYTVESCECFDGPTNGTTKDVAQDQAIAAAQAKADANEAAIALIP